MSELSIIDVMNLERAIADAGYEIPLSETKQLTISGVISVLQAAAKARDEKASSVLVSIAREERVLWEIKCLTKDVARLKERIAEKNQDIEKLIAERDEARADARKYEEQLTARRKRPSSTRRRTACAR